jgi:hypothetical protein
MKPKLKKATAKPSVKFKDLASKKNPKGGALDADIKVVGKPTGNSITWTWNDGG